MLSDSHDDSRNGVIMQDHENPSERRDRLQATYGRLYDDVLAIIQRADLIGIAYVADDEYEPEVTTILPRLHQANNEEDVATVIREEFDAWFYEGATCHKEDRVTWAAQEIWKAWQSYLSERDDESVGV
jgi:hypothetical protein